MNTTDEITWMPPMRPLLWTLLAVVSGYTLSELVSRLDFPEPQPLPVQVIPKRSPVQPHRVATHWRQVSEDYAFPTAEEFGANAVALVINAYRSANAGPQATRNWIRRHVPGLQQARWQPAELRTHALRSLAGLGRSYPAPVDRFYYEEIRTTNRIPILYSMATSGTRHFAFLTNLIDQGTIHDQGHAIAALDAMGTNAHAAVPLVISTLEKHGARSNETWWAGSLVLAHIGEHHASTVPTLLDQLEHPNVAARAMAARALLDVTNQLFRIRHEYVRLARLPITATNDPGEFVSEHLDQLGVPAEVAVPILLQRLRIAVNLDGSDPDFNSRTCRCLSTLSTYGTNAIAAVQLIAEHVISQPAPAPPVGSGRWRIQQSLRRIDPNWKLRSTSQSTKR